MKICVLGAGVIGVSTAYALGRLGHDVSVIEKAPRVAMGASKANGAQLSYSFTDPLASPKTLRQLPRYMLGLDKALQFKFSSDIEYLLWGFSFLKNCSRSRYSSNREKRQALSDLSRQALEIFQRELPNALQPTGKGKLILAQSLAENEAFKNENGYVPVEGCLEIEPALGTWQGPILGGLYSEDDYALNTVDYCEALRHAAEKDFNVKFFFKETIGNTIKIGDAVTGVSTDKQDHHADKVIVCLGNESHNFLKPFRLPLKIYPIQGYSLTLAAKKYSPHVSVTDLKNKIVYAHLGDAFRIAGFVDTNQRVKNIESRINCLLDKAKSNWPDVADFKGPIETWTGARPMTPSGVPVVGKSSIKGLYLNIGHGSLGYTFAAGSAMKIANEIGHSRKNSARAGGRFNAA